MATVVKEKTVAKGTKAAKATKTGAKAAKTAKATNQAAKAAKKVAPEETAKKAEPAKAAKKAEAEKASKKAEPVKASKKVAPAKAAKTAKREQAPETRSAPEKKASTGERSAAGRAARSSAAVAPVTPAKGARSSRREPHFRPELFFFFRELAANNEKAWFEANRERYERDVRAPMTKFVTDFAAHLAKISPHFVADARPVGGSLFRINRDVRFSKDKSPYKTNAAMQFRHAAGKDVHAPGYYLHLEPGSVFGGGGLWHPDAPTLAKVRAALVEAPAKWGRAIRHEPFVEHLELGGDALSRPPRGFDPEHPLIADLKRTDFVAMAELSERDACAPDFIDRYAELCRAALPFMQFLTNAIGLEA